MAPSSSQPSGSGHAPTESEHLPLLPRRKAQERTTDFSARSQQAHPPTHRQTVGRVYRSLGPSFLFRIFSEALSSAPATSPRPASSRPASLRFVSPRLTSRYIRFLYPRHGACSKIFDFRADGTCRAEGSSPSCSAAAAAAAAVASLSSTSSFSCLRGGPL